MELFVIRHTEVNNPENLCYGNIEMPLAKNYEKVTKKFFDNLPKNIEKIFSSPSKRCTDLLESMNLEFSKRKELNLITSIDERSAAFLALGISAASGEISCVITTSGSAVANLLPAAVEADRSCHPLLLISIL